MWHWCVAYLVELEFLNVLFASGLYKYNIFTIHVVHLLISSTFLVIYTSYDMLDYGSCLWSLSTIARKKLVLHRVRQPRSIYIAYKL